MNIKSIKTAGLLAAVCLLLGLAACSGDSSGPKATVAGTWSGNSTTSSGTPFTLNLVLAETSGTVSGTGTLVGATSIAVTVTGTFSAPSVGLTLSAPSFENLNFTATVSGKSMTGTLNGSGFTNNAITLTRP